MNHSPEPWRTDVWLDGPVQIVDSRNRPVCGHMNDIGGFVTAIQGSVSDLERIVACVNACAGIPSEVLESGWLARLLRLVQYIRVYDADNNAVDHEVVDWRRIVACINFLAGIPTEILTDILQDAQRPVTGKPLDDIRRHILRWHELNPHLWHKE